MEITEEQLSELIDIASEAQIHIMGEDPARKEEHNIAMCARLGRVFRIVDDVIGVIR